MRRFPILSLGLILLLAAGCKSTGDAADATETPAPEVDAGSGTVAPPDAPDTPQTPEKAEGETRDGLREGPWTLFHPGGEKAASGSYLHGEKNGRWTYYHENGDKAAEGEYVQGKKHGTWAEIDESGKSTEHRYQDGMELGGAHP
jgi:hypothetical protein